MTREELAAMLGRMKQARDQRVEIWLVIVEPDGSGGKRIVKTIYRGSFLTEDDAWFQPRT
jgi:hypothetical protein